MQSERSVAFGFALDSNREAFLIRSERKIVEAHRAQSGDVDEFEQGRERQVAVDKRFSGKQSVVEAGNLGESFRLERHSSGFELFLHVVYRVIEVELVAKDSNGRES